MLIEDTIIRNNSATQAGGGIYESGSFTFLTDVSILNNSVTGFNNLGGGGIYTKGFTLRDTREGDANRGAAILSYRF